MALWIVVLVGLAAAQNENERFGQRTIRCNTCQIDFATEPYRADHPCLVGDRRENSRDTSQCSRNSRYCMAEVARQSGILMSFKRVCADDCDETCSAQGFGIKRDTCTYCCVNDPSCAENSYQIKALYRSDVRGKTHSPIGNRRRNATNQHAFSTANKTTEYKALMAAIICIIVLIFVQK